MPAPIRAKLTILLVLLGIVLQLSGTVVSIIKLPFVEFNDPTVGSIYTTVWRPDGQMLALATETGVWLLSADLQIVTRLNDYESEVYDVSWNQDGTQLAGGTSDSTIRIWDMVESSPTYGQTVILLQETKPVTDVIWGNTYAPNLLLSAVVERIEYFSDGATAYFTVHIWDLDRQILSTLLNDQLSLSNLAWNFAGDKLVTTHSELNVGYVISLWEIPTGQLIGQRIYPGGVFEIQTLQWRPNSNTFFGGWDGGYFTLYDETLDEIGGLPPEIGESVYASAWSPDGNKVVIGTRYGSVQIWDFSVGQRLAHLDDGSESNVSNLAWSPDGTKVVSVNAENVAKIWDVSSLSDVRGIPTITPYPTSPPTATP